MIRKSIRTMQPNRSSRMKPSSRKKGEDTPDDQEEEMQQPESPIPMNPAGPARKRQGKTLRKKKMLPMEPALRIPWNISTPY